MISLYNLVSTGRPGGAALPGAATHPWGEAGGGVGARGGAQPAADGCQGQQPGRLPGRTGPEAERAGRQQLRPVGQHSGGGETFTSVLIDTYCTYAI